MEQGYDGMIVDDMGEGFTEYIVFNPAQIKSATENIGTYDRSKPDTTYSTREVSPEEKARLIKEDRGTENIERYGKQQKIICVNAKRTF